MNTEENELIVNNIGLAYELAIKYYNKIQHIIELDELQSIAFLGLVKAGKTFNKNLKFAFSTYAYNCIRNEIVHYIQNNIKNSNQSLDTQIADNLDLQHTIASDVNIEIDLVNKELINNLFRSINLLKYPYKDILTMKLKGYTFIQISNLLKINLSQVNQNYHKAINMLRYKLKDWRDDI